MLLKQLREMTAQSAQSAQSTIQQEAHPGMFVDYKQQLLDMVDDGKISIENALHMCLDTFSHTEVRDMLEKAGLISEFDPEDEVEDEDEKSVKEDGDTEDHEEGNEPTQIEQVLADALNIVRSTDWKQCVKDSGMSNEENAASAYEKLFNAALAYRELCHAMSEVK